MSVPSTRVAATPRLATAETRSFAGTVSYASLAMLVTYLPFSAINGALGALAQTTRADTHQLQWVTDAFTVALTGTVLSGGSLAHRYGCRRVTTGALAVTGLGSLIGWCAGASTGDAVVHVLWAAQAVTGIAAGLVMSSTLSLIAATAPSPVGRTRAISFWAAANVIGLGVGPFLTAGAGAAIHDANSWRWIYAFTLVLAAALALVGPLISRETSRTPADQTDLTGQVLGALTAVALVYAAISAGDAGPTAAPTLIGTGLAGILLTSLVRVEQRTETPALPPRLFTSPGFLAAGLAAAVVLFSVISVVFLFSLYLASDGTSSIGVATVVGCLFAGNALASVASGSLQHRFGSASVVLGGLLITITGVALLLRIDATTSTPGLIWRLVVLGAGCGTVVAASSALALHWAPAPLIATAGTTNNVLRQLGGALGAAVIGGVLASQLNAGADHLTATRIAVEVLLTVVSIATIAVLALLIAARPPSQH